MVGDFYGTALYMPTPTHAQAHKQNTEALFFHKLDSHGRFWFNDVIIKVLRLGAHRNGMGVRTGKTGNVGEHGACKSRGGRPIGLGDIYCYRF